MLFCALIWGHPVLAAQPEKLEQKAPKPNSIDAAIPVESVVLMPISFSKDIEPKIKVLINEVILSELSARVPKSIRVIGSSDIRALVGLDKSRAALGCDDSGCLVELGQALGASHMLKVNLATMGKTYVLNAKFLQVERVRILFRKVLYLEHSDEALLMGSQQMIDSLVNSQDWPSDDTKALATTDSGSKASGSDRSSRASLQTQGRVKRHKVHKKIRPNRQSRQKHKIQKETVSSTGLALWPALLGGGLGGTLLLGGIAGTGIFYVLLHETPLDNSASIKKYSSPPVTNSFMTDMTTGGFPALLFCEFYKTHKVLMET